MNPTIAENPVASSSPEAAENGAVGTMLERLTAFEAQHRNSCSFCITNTNVETGMFKVYAVNNENIFLLFHDSCPNTAQSVSDLFDCDADLMTAARYPICYEFESSERYVPVSSTTDLISLTSANRGLKLLGILILCVQIALMVLAISSTFVATRVQLTSTLIFVRLFISVYLGFKMSSSLSDSTKDVMDRIMSRWNADELRIAKCLLFFVLLLVGLPCCIPGMLFSFFFHYNWFVQNVPRKSYVLVVLWLEFSLMVVSVFATIVITRQQAGFIESIFNFVGLLLILELDDLVAISLQHHVHVLHVEYKHLSDRKNRNKHFSIHIVNSILVMIATYIALFSEYAPGRSGNIYI